LATLTVQERMDPVDLPILWGVSQSPFGACILGASSIGLCYLGFFDGAVSTAQRELQKTFPKVWLQRNDDWAAKRARRIFASRSSDAPLSLHLVGTPFQLSIWRALLDQDSGAWTSYGELARLAGHPKAPRAVGTAVGHNPLSWIIPCHHVLRANGTLGGYRWGIERKNAMLIWESATSPS